jgi:hypothetical protein
MQEQEITVGVAPTAGSLKKPNWLRVKFADWRKL